MARFKLVVSKFSSEISWMKSYFLSSSSSLPADDSDIAEDTKALLFGEKRSERHPCPFLVVLEQRERGKDDDGNDDNTRRGFNTTEEVALVV